MIVVEVVAKLTSLELMVTARVDTESQAVAAAVGLKVRVSALEQATPAD